MRAEKPTTTEQAHSPMSRSACEPGYSHVRVGVKALIVRGTEVLFNVNLDVHGRKVYVLPGGGQEHGESQSEALMRECEEEIGVRPRVYDLAFTFELRSTMIGARRDHGALFHQQNLAFWCDLPPGAQPRLAQGHDPSQVGVQWIQISELDAYDVRPRETAQWLQQDPSVRPRTLSIVEVPEHAHHWPQRRDEDSVPA